MRKLCALLVGSLVLNLMLVGAHPARAAAAGAWSSVAPLLTGRVWHRAEAVGGSIYAIGGTPGGCVPPSLKTEVYDPVANTWTARGLMPLGPRAEFATAVLDGKIYAFGGGDCMRYYADAARYDPATDQWTVLSPMPTTRSFGPAAVAVNGKIYIIAGVPFPGGPDAPTLEYDPLTGSYTTKAPMPVGRGRGRVGAAVIGNSIYMAGGEHAGSQALVDRYDPVSDIWTALAPMSIGRSFPAVAAIGGRLYAAGGNDPSGRVLDSAEVYDPGSNSWSAISSLPMPATGAGATVLNGTFYVIGGFDGSIRSGAAFALAPAPVRPASLLVNSTADGPDAAPGDGVCATASGGCTVRAAVMEANAWNSAITISLGSALNGTPITVGSQIAITSPSGITIKGAGAASTIIQGCDAAANPACLGASRIFDVQDGAALTVDGVTLRNGRGPSEAFGRSGGAIRVGVHLPWEGGNGTSSSLTLNNSALLNNTSVDSGGAIVSIGRVTITNSVLAGNSSGGAGGGIFNNLGGVLTITNSTINRNSAASSGGGIFSNAGSLPADAWISDTTISGNRAGAGGGILANGARFFITNSTFSGNSASSAGGAIYADGPVQLASVTLSGNTAPTGGALYRGSVTLKNTILATDVGGNCAAGTPASQGYNLSDDASCALAGTGDRMGAAGLGVLADNGGPTRTHALLPGSPAIDAGDPAGCTDTFGTTLATDQRGAGHPRAIDALGRGNARCDIGAFEATPNTTTGAPVQLPGPPPTTLTFSNVTRPGMTTMTTSTTGPTPPAGFALGVPAMYLDITTTATFTGSVTMCVSYADMTFLTPPRLYHFVGGVWVDTNATNDIVAKTLCGVVASLSPFALFRQLDITPPVTTATVSPGPSAAGWNNTDVTVTVQATDDMSGVASTTVTLDGAPVVGTTVTVTAEGVHTVTYSSTDIAGNVEPTRTLLVRIDKTAPEVVTRFDTTAFGVPVSGRDALSGIATVTLTTAPAPKKGPVGGDKAVRRTYVIADKAGNATTLVEDVRAAGHELRAAMVSIRYGAGPEIAFPENELTFEWALGNDGSLKELEQAIEVSGPSEQNVDAKFNAKKNVTVITVHEPDPERRITRSGLVLVELVTNDGQLAIEIP